jgi:hypothetical protein
VSWTDQRTAQFRSRTIVASHRPPSLFHLSRSPNSALAPIPLASVRPNETRGLGLDTVEASDRSFRFLDHEVPSGRLSPSLGQPDARGRKCEIAVGDPLGHRLVRAPVEHRSVGWTFQTLFCFTIAYSVDGEGKRRERSVSGCCARLPRSGWSASASPRSRPTIWII